MKSSILPTFVTLQPIARLVISELIDEFEERKKEFINYIDVGAGEVEYWRGKISETTFIREKLKLILGENDD